MIFFLDGFPPPPIRRFVESHKIPFFRDSSVPKNKQGTDMAYFVRNASKIAFRRIKLIYLIEKLVEKY
jgi:hypothetical protein